MKDGNITLFSSQLKSNGGVTHVVRLTMQFYRDLDIETFTSKFLFIVRVLIVENELYLNHHNYDANLFNLYSIFKQANGRNVGKVKLLTTICTFTPNDGVWTMYDEEILSLNRLLLRQSDGFSNPIFVI
jgi:hypothetical protein